MPGRNKRERFNFVIGKGLEDRETSEVLRHACAQVDLARMAVKDASRALALARLESADEALRELRRRDDRLRLW